MSILTFPRQHRVFHQTYWKEKNRPIWLGLRLMLCATARDFGIHFGSVEKSRQRRSRHFPVLTYYAYAPRVKTAAALLDGLF